MRVSVRVATWADQLIGDLWTEECTICVVEVHACGFDALSEVGTLVALGLSWAVVQAAQEGFVGCRLETVHCFTALILDVYAHQYKYYDGGAG